MARQAPDVGLARANRLRERHPIPVASLEPQPRQLVHTSGRRYWRNSVAPGGDYFFVNERWAPGNPAQSERGPSGPARRAESGNFMDCTRIRHAISARLDGEDPGVDPAVLDQHLAGCAACRGFARSAERLHRNGRLEPAPDVPDLTPSILAAVGAEPAPPVRDTQLALRGVLVVLALVQIGVAIPALVFGSDAHLPVHAARHIGSFDVAVAVGFLFAAWRPSRIPGLLPVVAALVACLVGSTLLDVAAGNTAALGEAHHALAIAGLVVLWLIRRDLPVPSRVARYPEPA